MDNDSDKDWLIVTPWCEQTGWLEANEGAGQKLCYKQFDKGLTDYSQKLC